MRWPQIPRVRRLPLLTVLWAVTAGSVASIDARAQESAPADTLDSGGSTLIPFPFYFYSPETKSGGGVALTYFTRPDGAPADAKTSTYSTMLLFTQRKQFVANAGLDRYGAGERYELTGGVEFSRFPDTFYGIGNDTDRNVSEDFTPQTISMNLGLRKELRPELRAGPQAAFVYQEMKKVEPGGQLDGGTILGSRGGTLVLLGLSATWDGRDHVIYPRRGAYRVLTLDVSEDIWGSDFSYAQLHLDVRRYVSLSRGQVVALRGMITAMGGHPPFQTLAGLGGDSILRGYYAGRFRDRNRYVVEGEYRLGFWKRMGLAIFGGAGDVAHDLSTFQIDEVKLAAGYGLRFLLSRTEGVTLRVDWGYGEQGSSGFYLGILEAY